MYKTIAFFVLAVFFVTDAEAIYNWNSARTGGSETNPYDLWDGDNWIEDTSNDRNHRYLSVSEKTYFKSDNGDSLANDFVPQAGEFVFAGPLQFLCLKGASESKSVSIVKKSGNWMVCNYGFSAGYGYGSSFVFKNESGNITLTDDWGTGVGDLTLAWNSQSYAKIDNSSGDWSVAGDLFLANASASEAELVTASGVWSIAGTIVLGNHKASSGARMEINGGEIKTTGSGAIVIGCDGSGGECVVKTGGKLTSSSQLILGQHAKSVLDIAGGTVEVASGATIRLCDSEWCRTEDSEYVKLNVTDGGKLVFPGMSYGEGTVPVTVTIDQGTFQANAAGTLVPMNDNIAVSVGSLGATVDAGGFAVEIGAALTGEGSVAFKGGGSVTLKQSPGYSGTTTVELGTALITPSPIAAEKLAFSMPDNLADGIYDVVTVSGEGTFDNSVLDHIPDGVALLLSDDGKKITCTKGDLSGFPIWTGKVDNDICNPGNWLSGSVPDAGDAAIIRVSAPTVLTIPEGKKFSPSSLLFSAGSAKVTIEGPGTVSDIAAVTNSSSIAHEFQCKVNSDAIEFFNEKVPCSFTGGNTVKSPSFTAPETEPCRGISGAWVIDGDWTPVPGTVVCGGSSVTITGELLNPGYIGIYSDAVVTAATMKVTTSEYFANRNDGALVVSGELRTGDIPADSRFMNGSQGGIVEFGSFINDTQDKWTYINAPEIIVGAGGLDIVDWGSACFIDSVTMHPRTDAYEINSTYYYKYGTENNTGFFRMNGSKLTLSTVKYGTDEPATVTVNARLVQYYNSAKINVTGGGTVVFNSVSDFTGGLGIGSGATVVLKPGCQPGTGTIKAAGGGALKVAASETVALSGDLELEDGAALAFNFTENKVLPVLDVNGKTVTAGGTVKVAVSADDGLRPSGGRKAVTTGGGFAGVTVSLADNAPDWVNDVFVDSSGNIVLDIKLKQLIILVR